jgi:hypothetical protein
MTREPGAELYVEMHMIRAHLADAVREVIAEGGREPVELAAAYFERVRSGEHVRGRSFQRATSNPHDAAAFIRLLVSTLLPLDAGGALNGTQLLELLALVCGDMPPALVHRALALTHEALDPRTRAAAGADSALAELTLPLGLALLGLSTLLTYASFLRRALEIFHACDTRATGSVNCNVLRLTLRQMMAANAWPFATPAAGVVDALVVDTPAAAAREGAPVEISVREFEVKLFGACMAHADPALGLPSARRVDGVEGCARELERSKAQIRTRWAHRRSAGAQGWPGPSDST